MSAMLLLVIYLAFISLGLPDSILGAVWTTLHTDLGVPFGSAGIVSVTISLSTIAASLNLEWLNRKLGTGRLSLISVLFTSVALIGCSLAPSFLWIVLLAVPLGLGAGAVDGSLNNYVALHYKPHHMSWLHCFWGIGATLGPVIMSMFLKGTGNWRGGYGTIGFIQLAIGALLLLSLPLWGRFPSRVPEHVDSGSVSGSDSGAMPGASGSVFKMPGIRHALLSFTFYCGAEVTMGLWGASYLIQSRGLDAVSSARWVALYFGGITAGRFLTGFLTMRFTNTQLIRGGQVLSLAGVLLVMLPLPSLFAMAGFIAIGLGFAPVFPCMTHETPRRFGAAHSQKIIGYQMVAAYVGITFLPPLAGLLAPIVGMWIFPVLVMAYVAGMMFSSERIARLMARRLENMQ